MLRKILLVYSFSFFLISQVFAQQHVALQMLNVLEQQNLTKYFNVVDYKLTDSCRLLQLQLIAPSTSEAWKTWQDLDSILLSQKGFHLSSYLFYLYANVLQDTNLSNICMTVQEDYTPDARMRISIRFDGKTRDVITIIPGGLNKLMAATGKINIDNNFLLVNGGKISLSSDRQRRELFEHLYNHYYNAYKKQGGLRHQSGIGDVIIDRININSDGLIFIVRGLKREVLNQGNGFTCWLLKYLYKFSNCGPYEYLKISIFYNQNSQTLDFSADGKFSAGYDQVLSWEDAANMEPAYSKQLKAYAENVFREDLKLFLGIR